MTGMKDRSRDGEMGLKLGEWGDGRVPADQTLGAQETSSNTQLPAQAEAQLCGPGAVSVPLRSQCPLYRSSSPLQAEARHQPLSLPTGEAGDTSPALTLA